MSVFITGASSGFGEACARLFASAKRDLVLVARRLERLEALKKDLSAQYGVKVDCFELDVRSRAGVEKLVRAHPAVFDRVDVLINNAGLAKGVDPFQAGDPDDWDVMIDTNVKGLLYVTRAILPGMIKRGAGHIVNIGSVAGHWVYAGGAVYNATKYGVRAISEAIRLDLNGTGVRVTEISPGRAETEFSEVRLGDKAKAKAVYAGMTPLSARDVAEAVLWSVDRPKHVNIQEIILMPTDQAAITTFAGR